MPLQHATIKAPLQKVFAVADWNASHTGTLNHGTELTNVTPDQHHAETHTIVSHDTTTTGAQLDSAYAHSIDNTQAHTDYMLNTGDTSTGDYTFGANIYMGQILQMNHGSPIIRPNVDTGVMTIYGSLSANEGAKIQFFGADSASFPGDIYLDYGDYTKAAPASKLYIRAMNNSAVTNAIVCDVSGKVGIGTAAPAYKLHVAENTAALVNLYAPHTGAVPSTGYAGYFVKTGASGTNVGLYTTASGATNNYGLIVATGDVGIGTASPASKLQVAGAISSGIRDISASSDALDVADDNTIFVNTGGGDVTIGGLANGVLGQVVHISKRTWNNNLVIEHDEATGTQKIWTPDGLDMTLIKYQGVTMVFQGTYWFVVGAS